MVKSMAEVKGRMAVVLPQGALFRKGAEGSIRQKLLEMDLVEAVIGLAPNLFYGTGLAACILVLRKKKPAQRRKKVMIADASRLFRRGRAQNYLEPEHALEIQRWFEKFEDVQDAVRVVSLDDIKAEDWTLNISRYVLPPLQEDIPPLPEAIAAFKDALTRCRDAEDRLRQSHDRRRLAAMSARITQQELESYLWGAAVLLRGLIDAGDYKQFIFPLLFFKRVSDVWEEEYQAALADSDGDLSYAEFAENHRFQIPEGARWSEVRQTPKNVGMAIQTALRQLEAANPDLLAGIFGDAPWTNRERLPDETLKNLIEHFSTQTLSVANVPEDELGNAYEFLIKKFADDSGHTAAEFYTNRTVVHLMTQLLAPQAGESIYDPTCGTGGMLISALAEVKRSGGEYRTLKLYGQERNLITSGIARMNLFLHGVEDFQIIRGDTLADPKHIEGDRLRKFDVILANPPYSIKQWDREAWSQDKWGRNFLGTPPQGRADYAFQQHILASLSDKGRCAILWPHGVLFRNEEQTMRAKMVELDWVEAVIGLGPNLFYNSPMESCVVVCNRRKPAARKGKVLFIDALSEVTRERAQSFLTPKQQERILKTFRAFAAEAGFSAVATLAEIAANNANLSIPLYVKRVSATAYRQRHWQAGNPATRHGRSGKPMAEPSGSKWMRWWKHSTVW